METGLLGFIDTPAQGNIRPAGITWCADNGCFGKGYPGDTEWFSWLKRNAHDARTCLFATAPDVVGDAEATLARSLPWLQPIRSLGYPAALVAQNGAERINDMPWDQFDVLFLGGSLECLPCGYVRPTTAPKPPKGKRARCPACSRVLTEWKEGAVALRLLQEAQSRGKWVHMGRVNSGRRYDYARYIGCDSADGTYLTFGPDINLPKLLSWVDRIDLFGATA